MPEFIEFEWKDLHGVIRHLKQFETGIKDDIDRVLFKAGQLLKNEVRTLITEISMNNPKADGSGSGMLVDTGYYRQNWQVYVERKLGLRQAVVRTDTEYAKFLDEYAESMLGYKVTEQAWERCKTRVISYIDNELERVFLL